MSTMAIVELKETGQVVEVLPEWIKFLDTKLFNQQQIIVYDGYHKHVNDIETHDHDCDKSCDDDHCYWVSQENKETGGK